jgi:CO/xanthine dehydrogenase FAD-binding subunit
MRNSPEHRRPQTVEEALRLLSHGNDTAIDLSSLPLCYTQTDGGALLVGALISLETLSNSPSVRAFAGGILAETARSTCTSVLRNQETLATAILSDRANGELTSALLVLDADLLLQTTKGPAAWPIATLLENPETRERRAIPIEVRIPAPPSGSLLRRERIARTPRDRAILSVTALTRVVDGVIVECRIAVAG